MRSLVCWLVLHPVYQAVTQDSLSRWVCRVIGHRWDWPDIVVAIMPDGLRFLPQWRGCGRCGHREQDEARQGGIVVIPAFQGPVVGFGGDGEDRLGEQVNRAMGWK